MGARFLLLGERGGGVLVYHYSLRLYSPWRGASHFLFQFFECFEISLQSSEFQRSSTSTQQTALRRKKKKAKRLDTTTTGIFVRRGVSSPRTIHCLDKD